MTEAIVFIIAAVSLVIAIFSGGKQAGKDSVKSESAKKVLDNVSDAKKAADAVSAKSANDIRNSLRSDAKD